MDAGRIVAEGTDAALIGSLGESGTLALRVTGSTAARERWQQQIDTMTGVSGTRTTEEGMDVFARDVAGLIAPVARMAEQSDVTITGIEVVEPDLEAVFLHLTGRALRD